MPNPENIIPPKKGEVRNPKGKEPGTKNRATILKELIALNIKLKNPLTGKEETQQTEIMVNYALLAKAVTGDVQAIKEVNDTLYGKIPLLNELTGKDGKDLNPPFIVFKNFNDE
jgi:hypothetical protein